MYQQLKVLEKSRKSKPNKEAKQESKSGAGILHSRFAVCGYFVALVPDEYFSGDQSSTSHKRCQELLLGILIYGEE